MTMGETVHQHAFNELNGLYCDSSSVTLILSEYMLPYNSHYNGSIVVFKKEINISISKNFQSNCDSIYYYTNNYTVVMPNRYI